MCSSVSYKNVSIIKYVIRTYVGAIQFREK